QVKQHHVRAALTERLQRGGAVFGDLHLVAFPPQQVGQRVGEVGFVFDEKDAGHRSTTPLRSRAATAFCARFFLDFFFFFLGGSSSTGAGVVGRRIVNVDPRAGRDHSRTSPPCRCVA